MMNNISTYFNLFIFFVTERNKYQVAISKIHNATIFIMGYLRNKTKVGSKYHAAQILTSYDAW